MGYRHSKGLKLVVIVLLCAVLVVVLTACGREVIQQEEPEQLSEKDEFAQEKENVEQYLREKYGKEFVVEKSEYYRVYLGDEKKILTHVKSMDEPPIEFAVMRSADGKLYSETNFIREMANAEWYKCYLELKWQQDTQTMYKELADKVFEHDTLTTVRMSISREYIRSIKGEIPTYAETLKNDPKVFEAKYYTQSFKVIMFKNLSDIVEETEKTKLLTLAKALFEKGVKNCAINVYYYPSPIEDDVRGYIINKGLNGSDIVTNVESGTYGSNEYKRHYVEYLFMGMDFKEISDIEYSDIIFKKH